jgi:hypothetical protein
MIRRSLTALLLASATVLAHSSAFADGCSYQEQVTYVWGQPQVSLVYTCSGDSSSGSAGPASVTQQDLAMAQCLVNVSQTVILMPVCLLPDANDGPAEITPGVVAAAFTRLPLPPSKLIVQPPNGRTLVNLETNFFTKTEPFTRSVTLLGQRIQLTITPTSFEWRFGDGESTSTSSPGSAYPDLEITHTYQRKGRVTPSVDTTYTATYRVNGGPSQPVPGSVTIPGEPVPLRVITASPQLVG